MTPGDFTRMHASPLGNCTCRRCYLKDFEALLILAEFEEAEDAPLAPQPVCVCVCARARARARVITDVFLCTCARMRVLACGQCRVEVGTRASGEDESVATAMTMIST